MTFRALRRAVAVLSIAALSACAGGGGDPAATGVEVTVAPASVRLDPAAAQQFTASVTGTADAAVTWRVQEAGGGQVDGTGRYVAPGTAGVFHVVATSAADTSRSGTATVVVGAASAPADGLHVSGNRILDASGQEVRLHGVNRAGTEYACAQGWGIFDGPSDLASIQAIKSWRANAVRIPLNESCWLGINGVAPQYGGAAYQQAIASYVALVLQEGLVPILDLHRTAPGTQLATQQQPMPDRDHSPTFWTQVAQAYAGQGGVVFELFNEPYPDSQQNTEAAWTCWRDGGTCPGVPFTAAGMQELVDAVRGTGATNLLLLGGVQYSNNLTGWLSHAPVDPAGNMAAAWHVYNFNVCSTTACYETNAGPVLATVPVVATEIGQDDCQGGFITTLMTWLDGRGGSYVPWLWNTWGTCLSLVSAYDGTPRGAYGQAYHDHLASLP